MAEEIRCDQPLVFSLPALNARGRVVRLEGVLDDILSAHDYPMPVMRVLGEAVTLAALMGSLMKEAGSQMTMQAQTPDGPVDLLVADYRQGELRGHARFDAARVADLGPHPALKTLLGDGYLAITFDLATSGERYQGIVPLEGDSLALACQHYFEQSEQLPTLIRIAVDKREGHCRAGGLIVQHLPDGEEGRERLHTQMDHPEWEHVLALADTITDDELLDHDLSMEDLVWRLFNQDQPMVSAGPQLSKGCRCTLAHFRDVIGRFPADDRADMIDDDGLIHVDCAFCSKRFDLEPLEF